MNYSQLLSFENNIESTISLYPNPFTSQAFLKVNLAEEAEIKILVTDIAGKEMMNEVTVSSEINFGKEFSPGVYLVYVEAGGKRKVVRLVKN
ncbi:MAG: T9SS type A sorting domain-containing protein [Cytophagaceae bacterium]|nr:T9SS type A sorting domain-containing protein [Cytophagaceae bacterium]